MAPSDLHSGAAWMKSSIESSSSLGGHGLSLESQRRAHGKERLRQPCPSQEAEGPRHAGGSLTGEQRQIESPIEGRACLRRAEGPNGLVHPHHRDCAGNGENRTGEPRLQHQTIAVMTPAIFGGTDAGGAPCLEHNSRCAVGVLRRVYDRQDSSASNVGRFANRWSFDDDTKRIRLRVGRER